MESSGPWWVTPVLTLGGVLLTLFVTVWMEARRGKRESRNRWVQHKMGLYSEFLDACDQLRDVPVWPADVAPTVTRVRQVARRAAYPAPAAVRGALDGAVAAARELVGTITDLRKTTTQGYQGALDERARPRLEAALAAFDENVDAFVVASRADVDINDPLQ